MTNIFLKVPNINELHYRQIWMQDCKTMSYNAGFNLDIQGYDKNTGTIKKTDEELMRWYKSWINREPNKYFAYIYTDNIEEPIGEVYYYLSDEVHSIGIVIQDKYRENGYSSKALLELEKVAFEKNQVSELSDFIPIDRISTIKTFEKVGFIQTSVKQEAAIFENLCIARQMLITKEMYFVNKVA